MPIVRGAGVLLALFSFPVRFAAPQATGPITDPAAARLVTEDIPRFWKAWDRMAEATTRRDSLRALFEEYYLEASPGLEAFIRLRIGSPFDLLEALVSRRAYYASIRPATLGVLTIEPALRTSLTRLKALYEEAVFPPVYFLIGKMSSGGTLSRSGLFIGTEIYSRAPDAPVGELSAWERDVTRSPEGLVCIVLHELVHAQQRIPEQPRTLLRQAFREGSADFIAGLVCGGSINSHVSAWVRAEPDREDALWRAFRPMMHGTDYSGWLYNASEDRGGKPADLGYYMGYLIAKAYYDRSPDKRKAVRDILTAGDPSAIYQGSGLAAP